MLARSGLEVLQMGQRGTVARSDASVNLDAGLNGEELPQLWRSQHLGNRGAIRSLGSGRKQERRRLASPHNVDLPATRFQKLRGKTFHRLALRQLQPAH